VPFEGDTTLAIILSKVLLLAEDTAITDPTITRQLLQA
jgi:ABC-type arginine transport system ATPase subunit